MDSVSALYGALSFAQVLDADVIPFTSSADTDEPHVRSITRKFNIPKPIHVVDVEPLDLTDPPWFSRIRNEYLRERGKVETVYDAFDFESEAQEIRCTTSSISAMLSQTSVIESSLYSFDQIERRLNAIVDMWLIVTQPPSATIPATAWIVRDVVVMKPTEMLLDGMRNQNNYISDVVATVEEVYLIGSEMFDSVMLPRYQALGPTNMSYERWARLNSKRRRTAENPINGAHYVHSDVTMVDNYTLFPLPILVGSRTCIEDPRNYGQDISRGASVTRSESGPVTLRMFPPKLKRRQNVPNTYYVDTGSSDLLVVRVMTVGDLGHTSTGVFRIAQQKDANPYGSGLSYKVIGEEKDEVVIAAQEWNYYREQSENQTKLNDPEEGSKDAKYPLPVRYNLLVFIACVIAFEEQFARYQHAHAEYERMEAAGISKADLDMWRARYHAAEYGKDASLTAEDMHATFNARMQVQVLFNWTMSDINDFAPTTLHVERAWVMLSEYLEREESPEYAKASRAALAMTKKLALEKIKRPDLGLYVASRAVRTSGNADVKQLWSEMARRFVIPGKAPLLHILRQNRVYMSQCRRYYGTDNDDTLYDAAVARHIIHRAMVSMWHSPWRTGETPEFYNSIKLRVMDMVNRLFRVHVAKFPVPDKEDWRIRTLAHVATKIVDDTFRIRFMKLIRLIYLATGTNSGSVRKTKSSRSRKFVDYRNITTSMEHFRKSISTDIAEGMISGSWGNTESTAETMAHELGTTSSNAGIVAKASTVFTQFNPQSSARETRDTHPTQVTVVDSTGTPADTDRVGSLRYGNSMLHYSVSHSTDAMVEKITAHLDREYGQSGSYLDLGLFRVSVNLMAIYWVPVPTDTIEAYLRHLKVTYQLPFDVEITNDGITVNVQTTNGRAYTPYYICTPGTTLPTCIDILIDHLGVHKRPRTGADGSIDERPGDLYPGITQEDYRNIPEDLGGESQMKKLYQFDISLLEGHIEWLSVTEQYDTKISPEWNASDLGCTYVVISPGSFFSLLNIVGSARQYNEGPRNIYGTMTYSSALTEATMLNRAMIDSGAMKKILTLNNGCAPMFNMPGHFGIANVGFPIITYTETILASRYNNTLEDTYCGSKVARAAGKLSHTKHTRIKVSSLSKNQSMTFIDAYNRAPTPEDGLVEWLAENDHLTELNRFPGVYVAAMGTRIIPNTIAIAVFSSEDSSVGRSSHRFPHYLTGVVSGISVYLDGDNEDTGPVITDIQLTGQSVYEMGSATKAFDEDAQKKETGETHDAHEMPYIKNSRGHLRPLETVSPSASQPSRNTGGRIIRQAAMHAAISAGVQISIDVNTPFRAASDPMLQRLVESHHWPMVSEIYDAWGNYVGSVGVHMYGQYLSNQHHSNKMQVQSQIDAERPGARNPTTGNLERGRAEGKHRGSMATQEAAILAVTNTRVALNALANEKTSNLRPYAICEECKVPAYVARNVEQRVVTYSIVCPQCNKLLTMDNKYNVIDRPNSGSFVRIITRQSMVRAYNFAHQLTMEQKWLTTPVTKGVKYSFESLPDAI